MKVLDTGSGESVRSEPRDPRGQRFLILARLSRHWPTSEPQSHTRYFRDYANNNAAVFTERVVALDLADFEARSNATVDSVVKKAAQEAHKADLSPVPYCTFRYF